MTHSRSDSSDGSRQARTLLLATDNKRSIIAEITADRTNPIAYPPYGQQSGQQVVTTGLGFNGELREARLGWYLLGNGYRAYNPILMRFHSPDSWSPFGRGGLNAYTYCEGDPMNFSDPTGHTLQSFWLRLTGQRPSRSSSEASLISNSSSTSPGVSNTSTGGNTRTTGQTPPGQYGQQSPTTDPTTGDPIYDHLPFGARTWTPPSHPPLREGMMTYSEMAQQQNQREVWRSEPSTARMNDSGGQVAISQSSPSPSPSPTLPPPRPERYLSNGSVIGSDGVTRMTFSNIQRTLQGQPPLHPKKSKDRIRKS